MSGNYSEIISKRFREILNSKGWTYSEFLKNKGLTDYKNSIDNVYYGRSEDPRISTLMIISEALNVGVNCLMGKCQHTPEERQLLRYYRDSGNHGKSLILLTAKYECLTARDEREATDKHSIPCLIPKGNMRQGIVYDDSETTNIYTSDKDAYVAIKMTNNDLVPAYCKDDIILVANRFPSNNEYGVFYKDGKAYIRQYIEEDNRYRLKCLHDYGSDMIFKRMDEIEYIGTCCGVIRA